MADLPLLERLRHRLQQDPASIAFAQLAEECRRAGLNDEAVRVGEAGLARHPTYVSARVTLGRALLALGRADEAEAEFQQVLASAPENLAARRELAGIHQRRGSLQAALVEYRAALALAGDDPDLARAVEQLSGDMRASSGMSERDSRVVLALERFLTAIDVARTQRGA